MLSVRLIVVIIFYFLSIHFKRGKEKHFISVEQNKYKKDTYCSQKEEERGRRSAATPRHGGDSGKMLTTASKFLRR